MAIPTPTDIQLHQTSRKLEIAFSDGARFELPYEFLRVYSPSAEVALPLSNVAFLRSTPPDLFFV